MKRNTQLISILLLCLVTLFSLDVQAQKKKDTKGKKFKTPFEGKKYQTDESYFRALGNAEGSSAMMAETKARSIAVGAISDQIEVTVKKVTEGYMSETQVNGDVTTQAAFESLMTSTSENALSGIRDMDKEIYTIVRKLKKRDKHGNKKITVYNCYIVVELSKVEVKKAIQKAAFEEQKQKIDFDEAEYMKIFDQELQKLSDDK